MLLLDDGNCLPTKLLARLGTWRYLELGTETKRAMIDRAGRSQREYSLTVSDSALFLGLVM